MTRGYYRGPIGTDPVRRARLRLVFEGRCAQLDAARRGERAYGSAVVKYVRARTAWRSYRGWRS